MSLLDDFQASLKTIPAETLRLLEAANTEPVGQSSLPTSLNDDLEESRRLD